MTRIETSPPVGVRITRVTLERIRRTSGGNAYRVTDENGNVLLEAARDPQA